MSRSLVPLDIIASDIADDMGDSTGKLKFKILRKLLAGYREMHLFVDHDFCVKTAVLDCDNVIEMPSDFVYETKVGLMRNGRIAVMTIDADIQKMDVSQEETQNKIEEIFNAVEYGIEGYVFHNYRNGDSLGELYGVGGIFNTNGFYNINRSEGEIYIGSLTPTDCQVVVEYKSDGVSGGLSLVPTEMVMALTYYAKSEFYADSNPNLASMNRRYYEREYNKVKRLYNFRDALHLADDVVSHYRSSPR